MLHGRYAALVMLKKYQVDTPPTRTYWLWWIMLFLLGVLAYTVIA